ncbi:hypothetical protein HELRODRAFT_114577 [Helobdella robusta]|uniref:Small integral membrane protein 4 n=1 Tax=Helobdella robusta TaxID=6412 RepID=T1EG32_HELRO|nr:hypothetical protein HELRODRAFT_114577 [Helobdella robusta]ESN95788.1 hypothetical protein HELRODRAFT_114577 [Helobdella robusta]
MFYSNKLAVLLNRWPGKERFGMYRFLPVFFVLGAVLEFSMIKWQVGEVNFYSIYKKKQAQKIILAEMNNAADESV